MKLAFWKKTTQTSPERERFGGLTIPAWKWGAIKDAAKMMGKSENTVIRKAIDEYLTRHLHRTEPVNQDREM